VDGLLVRRGFRFTGCGQQHGSRPYRLDLVFGGREY
jgi:hypothetical protein